MVRNLNKTTARRRLRARAVHRRGGVGPAQLQAGRVAGQGAVQRHAGGPRVRGQHQPRQPVQGQQAVPLPRVQEAAQDRPHLHIQLVPEDGADARALDAEGRGDTVRHQVIVTVFCFLV